MTKFFSRYPDGAAGIALLLLRISCALIAFRVIAGLPLPASFSTVATLFSIAVASALVVGVVVRASAFVLSMALLADIFAAEGDLNLFAYAGVYLALVLLGPGAYSIDANIFGRRVIRLEPRSPDRGSDD